MRFKFVVAGLLGLFVLSTLFLVQCTKNNPQPPVHDTVTVVKHDTTTTTDTLYASKPDSTVNLTRGLLLYLPFDGNYADSSGNGNLTTAVGSVLTYDAHGYANQAFGATGNGERIYVTNNGSIKFDTAFSLSFGFMVNVAGAQYTYISMVDPATAFGPSFLVGTSLISNRTIDVGTDDVSRGCSIAGSVDNTNITDTTGFNPVPGSWYNSIVIYHKGTIRTYINGTLISTKVGQGTAVQVCPNSQVIIGAWWNSDPLSMNGKLDNIRLYNRVLTPHEIVALSSNYQVTSNSVKPGVKTR